MNEVEKDERGADEEGRASVRVGVERCLGDEKRYVL